jgi:predicted Fe-S protein YdhL (DUF1289 family)
MNNMNIDNPCMGICEYNKDNLCIGCKRNMNEIFDWYDYTDEQVAAINEELKTRKVEGYFFDEV